MKIKVKESDINFKLKVSHKELVLIRLALSQATFSINNFSSEEQKVLLQSLNSVLFDKDEFDSVYQIVNEFSELQKDINKTIKDIDVY